MEQPCINLHSADRFFNEALVLCIKTVSTQSFIVGKKLKSYEDVLINPNSLEIKFVN